ncbi:MAG TPA: isoprenylcysteine carboxylmethyltransferase family protein [Anaerolineae bacterium]|nr:isoprenylcysteine carboxylmethyltransferase family protein [Anaerolineae bacterium]
MQAQPSIQPQPSHALVKRLAQIIGTLALTMSLFFLGAGRLDIPMAWVYIAVYLIYLVVIALIMHDPELIKERSHTPADAKPWDRKLMKVYGLCVLAMFFASGLNVGRLPQSPQVPPPLQIVALSVGILSLGLIGWAMRTNTFFSTVVRIQAERGHHVIDTGPYRYVRHPGYVAMIGSIIATPLVFGSVWGLIPAALAAGIIGARTVVEDRTLQAELPGYTAYTRRVRYRLLPGIW